MTKTQAWNWVLMLYNFIELWFWQGNEHKFILMTFNFGSKNVSLYFGKVEKLIYRWANGSLSFWKLVLISCQLLISFTSSPQLSSPWSLKYLTEDNLQIFSCWQWKCENLWLGRADILDISLPIKSIVSYLKLIEHETLHEQQRNSVILETESTHEDLLRSSSHFISSQEGIYSTEHLYW